MKQIDLAKAPAFKAIHGARVASAAVDQFHVRAYAEFWHSYERCIRLTQAVARGEHVNRAME